MPTPLLTTARRTAALLGPGWRAAPLEGWAAAALLTAPRSGGDAYRIRRAQDGARLVAYGYLEKSEDHRLLHSADAPQITVSADLPARQIPRHLAAHLKRRFLPVYRAALDAVAEDRARYASECAERDALTQRLQDAMPHARTHETYLSRDRRTVRASNHLRSSLYIAADVAHDGGQVDLTLHNLTPEQAEAVCQLLAPDL